jgi:hypothetical protein
MTKATGKAARRRVCAAKRPSKISIDLLALLLLRDLTAKVNAFYIRGTDLRTGLPSSLENDIPRLDGPGTNAAVRYSFNF